MQGARHKMATRTVAYINTDICTSGPEYAMSGSPIFTAAFAKAIKYVSVERKILDFENSCREAWSYLDVLGNARVLIVAICTVTVIESKHELTPNMTSIIMPVFTVAFTLVIV